MTWNIPEYFKEVSLRLNGVLDAIGLREDIRWKRINMWIQSEEAQACNFGNGSHLFGSQAEGTTTPGLQSDVDTFFPLSTTAVHAVENWVLYTNSVLVVSDENTPPGFVKLQPIENDLQTTGIYCKSDRYGRSVLCNDYFEMRNDEWERHGPATTYHAYNSVTKLSFDIVLGIKLYAWPDQASHWLTRNRRYNWPSQEMIVLIQQTGALLVPVGHKHSQEQHLEWRISISYGEKLLVWFFNSTQYKCYILLKMINKTFIKPVVGDDTLSSYHFKTCMFHLIENTPATIWQPENLLLCVEMCLRLVYVWVEGEICPNYFIPEENMFQCKIYGHISRQLLRVLSNLLNEGCIYLVRISCDNIGEKLVRACQTPLKELKLQGEDAREVIFTSAIMLRVCIQRTVQYAFSNDWIFYSRVTVRRFFCHKPRREVHTILRTFLCSFIGSKLAAQSLIDENLDNHSLDMAQEFLLWGSSSDVTSGKLKLAAFYLVQDNLNICKDVLNEIHEKYSYKILDQNNKSRHMLQAILSENLSTSQLISQYIAFPVHYHPSEMNITPKALIIEMFRSTGSDEVFSHKNYLRKLASVDPKVYLYFLDFLCYHRQNKRLHKVVALNNMIFVIQHERLDFMDTALNLLAYCLIQEGIFLGAYNILCKSMKLKKALNASKWQITTILNHSFRFRRSEQLYG
ncbi:hypothetical protein ACJMK2_012442 [Sinanodonta woodiana]|uniref:Mab-21-like HhH/H2TH-like domain-containing protein n=1 Tax=Sinanodonta woodiana TaxID=1069815 RepID=A0ABD3V875_SINWO